MPMNFEKFEYKSPIEEPITYAYILKYFDQYVKLFENLKPSDELETIIKHAYAPQELRGILKELEKIKIEKLNSENEYISLKTSCRWLALGNPQISLNHFATLGAQIVTRVAMVLGEVIKNLKKFLGFEETAALNNEIISSKLQTADSFEDTNYKILSCHINGEVAKYFSEENIELPPIDSENRIESLLNNKIIINCVELYEIAKDTATSYDTAVQNGGMQTFIEDITSFFKNGYNKKRATISQVFSNTAERKLSNKRSDNSKEPSASAKTVDAVVDILRFLASKHEDKLTTDSDLGELFVFANDWLLRSGKKTSDVETNTILNKLRVNRQIKEIFYTHTTRNTDDAPTEKKKGTWLRRISKKIKKLLKFRKTFIKLWSSEDNKSDSETSSMELGDAVKRLKKLVNYPPNN